MFDLCKKVNVYTIENHYHYHSTQHNTSFDKCKIGIGKLCARPIVVTSKNNNASVSYRKGIKLAQTLSKNQQIIDPITQHRVGSVELRSKKQVQNLTSFYQHQQQLLISTKASEISKRNAITSQQITFNLPQNRATPELLTKKRSYSQKLPAKSKPRTVSGIRTMETLPLTAKKLGETSSSGLGFQNISSSNHNDGRSHADKINKSHKLVDQQQQISFILKNQVSLDDSRMSQNSGLNTQFYEHYLQDSKQKIVGDEPSYTISFNFCHQPSVSPNNNQNEITNNHNHRLSKLATTPNSASIILSEILSRNNSKQELTLDNDKKQGLFREIDRATIKSYDADFSQFSVHVEQSIICDHNPRQNFLQLIRDRRPTCQMVICVQKNIGCLVMIKQLNFDCMELIAQQLRAYKIIENQLKYSEYSPNILSLLQVQVTSGSYLFIKQPYEISLPDSIKKTKRNSEILNQIKRQLFELTHTVIDLLRKCNLVPVKQIRVEDFVVCCGVIKFENMQIFNCLDIIQNHQIYSKQNIILGLQRQVDQL